MSKVSESKDPNNLKVTEADVRLKAIIEIGNVGLKRVGGTAGLPPGVDYYFDCRGLPDGVTGLKGMSANQFVESQINLGAYVSVILDVIHRIPPRRYNQGENWYKAPIRICCFCAWGLNRSRTMRDLLLREIADLGYNVSKVEFSQNDIDRLE
jgi:hypothetical protein